MSDPDGTGGCIFNLAVAMLTYRVQQPMPDTVWAIRRWITLVYL
jgi:hypothetical protein